MDSYKKEAIFHLPGIFHNIVLYNSFFSEIDSNPDILKTNIKIGSGYGSPVAIWNGGRQMSGTSMTEDDLQIVLTVCNARNIPVRFTFTNCMLKPEHLQNEYCNLILKIFNTGINEIICNSELLEDYIRNQYGNQYKYISSTTKRITNKDDLLHELEKNYYLVVLDYDFNKDFKFLEQLPSKNKCELLCNPVCIENCPQRIAHYKELSLKQINNERTDFACPYSGAQFYEAKTRKNFISVEDINNIYLPMGFHNFKLEGRTTDNFDLVEILLYYLIKEQYKDEIRSKMKQVILFMDQQNKDN